MLVDQRSILVSGGSRGLGQAMVARFISQGHAVSTFSRTATPFIDACRRDHGDRFLWEALDAEDMEGLRTFTQRVETRWGQIDVLANNAAVGVEGVLPMMQAADIHRVIAINLEASITLAQACSRAMLRQRSGIILNISSIAGQRGLGGISVYSATKAALDGLTRSLARELGPAGIRVCSIAPGYFETDMSSSLAPAQRQQIVRRTPLGRLATTDDVVGVIDFLLSPAASFMTGQVLTVDGGFTC